ncbi:MAG: hypothetical protein SVP26_02125 [Chloroflexota bacterium]|nr:hypothetical protein [Chloroflexota bacterium]
MKKRPDLLVLIAVWEFVTAFGAFVGVVCILAFAFPGMVWMDTPSTAAALFVLSIPLVVLLCYTGLALAGGIGLLKDMEWARILSIVHSAVTLAWVPVGTVIGVLVLIYLTKPEVREYFETARE